MTEGSVGEGPAGHLGLGEAVRFQRDLYLYWREAGDGQGLPLTSRRFVARPALRRIRSALAAATPGAEPPTGGGSDPAEAEDPRAFYLRRLLERLGLLRAAPDGSRLLAAERGEMVRLLGHPLAERLRICARLWVAGGWWPDRTNPSAEPPRLLAPAPPRLALARRRTLEMLAAGAAGDTIPIPPGAGEMAKATTRRTRPARRREPPRPAGGPGEGEDETVRAALLGPLAWMGFVAPEAASGAAATSCRASVALAALRAAPDDAALAEGHGRVIVQGDLSVIAYPPLTAPLLLALDTAADAEALDATARYRLTRAALARANQAGWDADGVARRLEKATGAPLPANVRVTLGDWARHVERVRLTPDVTLLETRTPAVLEALLADRAARGWVERRLTPTAALLVPGSAARVREWLLRRGELPALAASAGSEGGGANVPPA